MLTRRDVVARGALTLGGGLLGLSAAACSSPPPIRTGMVTIAYPADVPNWDPSSFSNVLAMSIHKCVFDQPMNIGPDLSFGPGPIESFQWLDAEGKHLELTIREGITFHNGDPLTSDDIKFTFFDRPKAEPTLVVAITWAGAIEAIECPSPTKAIFHFNRPFVIAPAHLGSNAAFIMPRRYFEQVGRTRFMEKPIGSGPYRLVEYQQDNHIILQAYDKYWRGPARIRDVAFQIVKNPSSRVAAIQSRQVDFAHVIPVPETTRLGTIKGLRSEIDPLTDVILINMVNAGIYKDQNLRLAMHHAIDKHALSKAFFNGKAQPLSMWAAPGMPANDPTFNFAFDPQMSRALLAKSGYGPDRPAKIKFYAFNGVFPNDFDIARAVVQMWNKVGIEADAVVLDVNKYHEMTRANKIDAPVLYSWSSPTGDPSSYTGSILDPKKRFTIWKSADISARLKPLEKEVDNDKRIAGFRKLDRWVVEQGYALPLLQAVSTVVHSERVGYKPYKNGWILPYEWTLH